MGFMGSLATILSESGIVINGRSRRKFLNNTRYAIITPIEKKTLGWIIEVGRHILCSKCRN